MEYTAKDYAIEVKDKLSSLGFLEPLDISNIKISDSSSFVMNSKFLIMGQPSVGVGTHTQIVRVSDITHLTIKNNDTVYIVTPTKTFSFITMGNAPELALAMLELL